MNTVVWEKRGEGKGQAVSGEGKLRSLRHPHPALRVCVSSPIFFFTSLISLPPLSPQLMEGKDA